MRESAVETYLKKTAISNGYLCYKFTSPGEDGVPDRVLIGHGLTFFVETKAPGKDLRKLQKYVRKQILNHGGIDLIIDTKEKVNQLFEMLSQNKNQKEVIECIIQSFGEKE